MKFIVFQHLAVEHPGVFRDFMRSDGIAWDVVALDEGDQIPDLAPYDAMLVMGGPQDIWQEREHPWLRAEKAAIRRFVVEMKRPMLGVCLGHQLLAEAVGGSVALASAPEVGVKSITKTEAARNDPLLAELDGELDVLQWHGAEVTALPVGAVALATSPACNVQAFRFGDRAYGIQYHVEVTGDTVDEWGAIPAYAQSLEKVMGKNAIGRLRDDVAAHLPDFNDHAQTLYRNFMALMTDSAKTR